MPIFDVAIEPYYPIVVRVKAESSTEAGLLAVLQQPDDNWRVSDVVEVEPTETVSADA